MRWPGGRAAGQIGGGPLLVGAATGPSSYVDRLKGVGGLGVG